MNREQQEQKQQQQQQQQQQQELLPPPAPASEFCTHRLVVDYVVTVEHLPTDENTADLFTKILSRQPFEKHRKVVLNLPGGLA